MTGVLDALGVGHTIGGSIANSIAGEPRSTIDIDVIAALEGRYVRQLIKALENEFYLDETALTRAVREHSTANLIHHETSTKINFFVAGGTPLDTQQIARRLRVNIGGRVLFVHPPVGLLNTEAIPVTMRRPKKARVMRVGFDLTTQARYTDVDSSCQRDMPIPPHQS